MGTTHTYTENPYTTTTTTTSSTTTSSTSTTTGCDVKKCFHLSDPLHKDAAEEDALWSLPIAFDKNRGQTMNPKLTANNLGGQGPKKNDDKEMMLRKGVVARSRGQ